MMRPRSILLFGIIGTAVFLFVLTGRLSSAGQNPKIEAFLKTIETANSLDPVSNAFKSANFSADELKQLETELRKPLYDNKLKGLAGNLKTPSNTAQVIQQKLSEFKVQQAQQLQKLNQPAQSKLHGPGSGIKIAPAVSHPSPQLGAALAGKIPLAQLPEVTSVNPYIAVVGQLVNIYGTKFGAARGSAYLEVGSYQTQCPDVRTWTDTHLTLTIPLELQPLVRDDNRNAKIYVQAQTGGTARGSLIVAPDPADLTPAITSLSATAITPGQMVIIEGRNFLNNQGQGIPWTTAAGVLFTIGTISVTADVTAWSDTGIGVILPSVSGLMGQNGIVQIKNKRGFVSPPKPFAFVPAQERVALCEVHKYDTFLWGETANYKDYQFSLINGWHVVESYLTVYTAGHAGSYFISHPSPGSTNARSEVRLWLDAFSDVHSYNYLVIEGPIGLPYK